MFLASLVFACSFQSAAAQPPAAVDPLDELIAKTNSLEGFTAEYRMTDREGVVSHVTLYYAAPDHAAMTMKSDQGTLRMWCDDGVICVSGKGETPYFARVNLRDLVEAQNRVVDVDLRAEFPGAPKPEPSPLPSGACFTWDWIPGEGGERPSTELAVEFNSARTHVGGWLKSLQRRSMEPHEAGDQLVWNVDERSEVHVSKTTGFITRDRSTDPESKGEVLLESLKLEPPDKEVFSTPDSAPEAAKDGSAEVLRAMRGQTLDDARTRIWTRLAKWIDDGQVTWDEHSPEKLTRVFRALHSEPFGLSMEAYLKKMRGWVDSAAEDLGSRVRALGPDDGGALASLRGDRDRALDDMSQQLGKAAESYCEKMRPPASVPADARLSDVFLECEREAIRAEYKSLVLDPLLALFREKTDAALER